MHKIECQDLVRECAIRAIIIPGVAFRWNWPRSLAGSTDLIDQTLLNNAPGFGDRIRVDP